MAAKKPPERSWRGEQLFELSQLGKQKGVPLRRTGETYRRWARKGVKAGRQRVYLPVLDIQGRLHCSLEAMQEFVAQIAAAQDDEQ
jgi:hypothetical protein